MNRTVTEIPVVAKLHVQFPQTEEERKRLVGWLRSTANEINKANSTDYAKKYTARLMGV